MLLNTSTLVLSSPPEKHLQQYQSVPENPLQFSRAESTEDVDRLYRTGISSLLRGGLSLVDGKLLHSDMRKAGFDRDTYVSNLLISMYAKCWALEEARSVFDNMHQRDVVSWNAMIAAYALHGHSRKALQLVTDMESASMEPDTITFISALQACANPAAMGEGVTIHACIVNHGFELDTAVGTALVNMYGKCDALETARAFFDKLDSFDTVPWNSLINAHSQQGHVREALQQFHKMQHQGVEPDKVTFVTVVSACADLEALDEGSLIHTCIRDGGFESEVVVCNALINMYGKCGALEEARAIFDKMQHRDVGSWNAMISAYAQDMDSHNALILFRCMQQEGVKHDKITLLNVLRACASLAAVTETKFIHANIVSDGFDLDVIVGTALLNTYGKCGACESARLLFNKLPQRNLVSWNALITVHAQLGHGKDALELFHQLQQEGMEPDKVTLTSALTACASFAALEEGKIIHTHIVDAGCEYAVVVGNALVSMYGKCGALKDADRVFGKMPQHSVVSWNAIMHAHAELGQGSTVLQLFELMLDKGFKPDYVTYLSVLSGCASLAVLAKGEWVHACIVRDGLKADSLENALVNMYGKCGALEDACRVFWRMHEHGVVFWNAMIVAYAEQGHAEEALSLFRQMEQIGMTPSESTFLCALGACASVVALAEGHMIHTCVAECGFETDIVMGTALMNMYGKCGALEDAREVFNEICERDVVTWNVMILVYGQQGHGEKALQLFQEMLWENVRPDDVTFVNLLSSCSHTGLVDEGQRCFVSMCEDYGITPTVNHYGCIIDLFGRAGRLAEAEDLIYTMSLQKHALVWMTLLGVSRLHGDMERGRLAADHVLELGAQESGTYILLSNILATDSIQDEIENVGHTMMELCVQKCQSDI